MRCSLFWICLCGSPLLAQTITGSILGSVKDPAGLAVVGADISVVQVSTTATRQAKTDARGGFAFSSLQPGEYNVTVASSGFKTIEKRGVTLSASETLSVGELVLEVGSVSDTVTVTAQGASVQTASSERAGVISSSQVENILVRGRSVTSLLQLLPGVVDTKNSDMLETGFQIYALGNRNNTNNVTMDGMTMNAIGSNTGTLVGISQDSVAEVKVQLANYQAEYGRMSGANVNLVTKSGTRNFHGLGSYFKRHEQFNANNFFNNRLGSPKAPYRFNTWTYNIGGPVYIPGKFNRNRDKLFFFWSQEFWPLTTAQPLTQRTAPTELERTGDFSQSLDLNGKLTAVIDPNTRQPFPGNRIPASRIDPNGQALLKVLPMPNFFDRTLSGGRYNYVFQNQLATPQRTEMLKLDYNASSRNVFFGNFTEYSNVADTFRGMNWPQMRTVFDQKGKAAVFRYTRLFSPTLINEFNIGFAHRPANDRLFDEEVTRNQRDSVGYKLGQLYGKSNPLGVIPNATFGGVTNAANLKIEGRFPLVTSHDSLSITNNATKNVGPHILKAGFYADRIWRDAAPQANFNGTFDFGRNVNNPLDTGYAYSNAILGVFNSYTEASFRPTPRFRVSNIEWFAQDNWKITRRLAFEFGLRFSVVSPLFEVDNQVSGFVPGVYDPSRQVRLIRPTMADGKRAGVSPVTGQIYPAVLIGAIAPGAGDPANGLVYTAQDPSYPRSLIENRGVQFAPRVGFAYDPFGKGKTAVRGGFGMFYNRENLDNVLNPYTSQAPIVSNPMMYFGTMSTLSSSTGLLSPQDVNGIDRVGKVPTVMNFSFSVQQNIGRGTVVDVGYVGSMGRHLMWQRNLNSVPFGANFKPANADPTNSRVPLPQNFLRPMIGYNDISYAEFASSSNYHSLQVTANRRFTRDLQFGVSWTWSRAMGYNDADGDSISNLVPVRIWNYGVAAFDRTHIVKINAMWEVPRSPFTQRAFKVVFNDWQVSGIASFISGQPQNIGFSTTSPLDITGSPTDGARIVVTGNPVLPKSERTFSRNFNTDVFQLPAPGTIGNAARNLIRGPGVNNIDIAIFKNFPIREKMRFQFRWEMYNALNHTQFSTFDTGARFDASGKQVNARFGEFTAARDPREMQLALRFYF